MGMLFSSCPWFAGLWGRQRIELEIVRLCY